MQVTKATEIWVGSFAALGLIALFFVAMQVSNLGDLSSSKGSYVIRAHFGNVGSLKVRAPVSMAGVTLGRVERVAFDADRYEALVEMRIDPQYSKIPDDTSASILTAGLLGEQYIGLSAGGSDDYLKDGDEIELTQSAMVLEQLISKFLFNKAEEGKGDKKDAQMQSAGGPSSNDQKGQTVLTDPSRAPVSAPIPENTPATPQPAKKDVRSSAQPQEKTADATGENKPSQRVSNKKSGHSRHVEKNKKQTR